MIELRFIIFVVILAAILVIVSLLLDPIIGIFITCLAACLLLKHTRDMKKMLSK